MNSSHKEEDRGKKISTVISSKSTERDIAHVENEATNDGEESRQHTFVEREHDGGWGWVVTAGSFAIHHNVLGLQYSFGVLYKVMLSLLSSSSSNLASSHNRCALNLWLSLCNIRPITKSLA